MKYNLKSALGLMMIVLMFAACNQRSDDKTGKVPDTKPLFTDTVAKDTVEVTEDPVLSIRRKVEHINNAKLDSQHVEFMCDEMTKVDHFYEGGRVVKISVDFGTIGDVYAKEDYYYDNDKLIFFYEFVEGGPACEGCIKQNEYRSYIQNDKVFRYLKDKNLADCRKCEFPRTSRQYKLLSAKTAAQIKAVMCP